MRPSIIIWRERVVRMLGKQYVPSSESRFGYQASGAQGRRVEMIVLPFAVREGYESNWANSVAACTFRADSVVRKTIARGDLDSR